MFEHDRMMALQCENERLQAAKRRALAVADERAQENVRLHASLTTACRQWKMYAEMEEGRDLLREQSPEGELYRSIIGQDEQKG